MATPTYKEKLSDVGGLFKPTGLPQPSFKDIAKRASDLLGKDYPVAGTKFELKTAAPNGVQFRVAGSQDPKVGSIGGELEGKYTDKPSGLTLTQAWTTYNALNTKLELDNQLAKGLKLDIATTFFANSGSKAAKVGYSYKHPSINTTATLDLLKGPTFIGDAVVGHDGFLAGVQVGYDVLDGRISQYAAAVGYQHPLYNAAIVADKNLSVFSASYYHKVNDRVDAGAKAAWDAKGSQSNVAIEVGTKYVLDKDTFVKAKINSAGVASVGYSQLLHPGVRFGFGASVDTKRLNEAAHKFGFDINVQA